MYQRRFEFIQAVRDFFLSQKFTQIDVPPMVENPGMEVHIKPFQVQDKYLQTSPEFFLKEILAKSDLKRIFSLCYVFRDEPRSPEHREQFLMLEWYRVNEDLNSIIFDLKTLIEQLLEKSINLQIKTVQDIFQEILQIDILQFSTLPLIKELFTHQFTELIPSDDSQLLWEDYFFLLFLNYIEPKLKNYSFLILKEYPAKLAALSKIDSQNKLVCRRFELYIDGVEIANCFHECTDATELRERFTEQNQLKKKLYSDELPMPERFLNAMETYPESVGIALGVERLYKVLYKDDQCFLD